MILKKSHAYLIITLLVLVWPVPSIVTGSQLSISDANQLINDGWSKLKSGYNLENSDNFEAAIQSYQTASEYAKKALEIAHKLHFIYYEKPSGLFFLHGQSRLALAEAYIKIHYRKDRIIDELVEAQKAFQTTLKTIDLHYRYKGPEWASKRLEALFALGSVFLLQGKNVKARNCMEDIVTNLDPAYQPAIYTIESIDFIHGHRTQNITSPGIRLPEPPKADSTGSQMMEYVVHIGHTAFGRWGSVGGKLTEELFN